MIRLVPLTLTAAILLTATATSPAQEKKDDSAERLLGTWVVESAQEEKKDVLDLQKARFIFEKSGRLIMELTSAPERVEKVELYYRLVSDKGDKGPKGIELSAVPINVKGSRGEHTRDRGIYKLEGDTLTLCICDGPGNDPPAPRDFEVRARYVTLVVLKREKK